MRSALVVAVLAVVVSVLALPAGAFTGVVLNIQADYVGGAWIATQVGWCDGYTTNGYDDEWDRTDTIGPLSFMVHTNVVNPVLGPGRWTTDFRAPLTPANGPEVWLIKATMPNMTDPETGQVAHFDAPFGIRAWFTQGYPLPSTGWLGTQSFMIFDGDVRENWATQTPLSVAPHDVSTVFYRSAATQFIIPDGGAHYFTVVIAPEPGSMAALAAGLIGLVGFGARRRRKV